MKIALIGPPTAGKTTLFEAIAPGGSTAARKGALGSNAVVKVPDPHVDRLTEIYKPKKTIHATVEFIDLPGLPTAGSGGDQRTRILSAARDAEALIEVAGLFDFGAGPRDLAAAEAELDGLRTEMALADLEIIEKRLDKLATQIQRKSGDPEQDKREHALLERLREAIENGALGAIDFSPEQEKIFRAYQFLAAKPRLTVYNLDETQFADTALRAQIESSGPNVIATCATLEQEIAQLSAEEQTEFLAEYGLTEPTSGRVVRACYHLLDLISFYTVGEDEVRAWTIQRGDTAVTAAGKIHSDIARGFIRAEVISYEDVIEHGDFKGAKAAGKMRLEGKEYEILPDHIVHFRFSV